MNFCLLVSWWLQQKNISESLAFNKLLREWVREMKIYSIGKLPVEYGGLIISKGNKLHWELWHIGAYYLWERASEKKKDISRMPYESFRRENPDCEGVYYSRRQNIPQIRSHKAGVFFSNIKRKEGSSSCFTLIEPKSSMWPEEFFIFISCFPFWKTSCLHGNCPLGGKLTNEKWNSKLEMSLPYAVHTQREMGGGGRDFPDICGKSQKYFLWGIIC